MSGLILPRRRFLSVLGGLIAAPAIVRVASLMPVKTPPSMMAPVGYLATVGGATAELFAFAQVLSDQERVALRNDIAAYYGVALHDITVARLSPS